MRLRRHPWGSTRGALGFACVGAAISLVIVLAPHRFTAGLVGLGSRATSSDDAGLAVTVTADSSTVPAGSQANYTIHVTNPTGKSVDPWSVTVATSPAGALVNPVSLAGDRSTTDCEESEVLPVTCHGNSAFSTTKTVTLTLHGTVSGATGFDVVAIVQPAGASESAPTNGGAPTSTPTAGATPTPTPGGTPTPSHGGTPTPTPGGTPTPNPGGTPTPSPGGTPTPNPGGSPTPNPGGTPTPNPGGTPTPNPGGTPTPNPGSTPTPNPGGTPTPNPGGTPTPNPGGTPTPNPGGTPTPSAGGTPTPSAGGTPTPIPGGTPTPNPRSTPTPSPGGGSSNPAQYPNAPAGGYPTIVGTFVVDGSGRPVSVSDHGITITVTVPAGALPVGTTIAIYRGDSSVLGGFLPAHKSYVDGYAVGWTAPDGSRPSAGSPIRIVVADGHAKAADILFVSSQSGLSPTTVPVSTGSWSTTFTADPGFVLAQAASAPATASPAPANTAPGTITSPSTGGAPVASNATPWWGWVAAVLALLALGGFVRRVRARG